MGLNLGARLKHAYNAFTNRDPTGSYISIGPGYSSRPDRPHNTAGRSWHRTHNRCARS